MDECVWCKLYKLNMGRFAKHEMFEQKDVLCCGKTSKIFTLIDKLIVLERGNG